MAPWDFTDLLPQITLKTWHLRDPLGLPSSHQPFSCLHFPWGMLSPQSCYSDLSQTLIFCFFLIIIYFWLCWVFIAVRGLYLRCTGFSLQWLLLLPSTGYRACGLSSCSSWHETGFCPPRAGVAKYFLKGRNGKY